MTFPKFLLVVVLSHYRQLLESWQEFASRLVLDIQATNPFQHYRLL
jgi:hypothetical protein